MGNVRFPKDHSRKGCTCGGHNGKNRKKQLTHNATRVRLDRRMAGKAKRRRKGAKR